MVRIVLAMVLSGLFFLPVSAFAEGSQEVALQIERLSRELDNLKKELAKLQEENEEKAEIIEEVEEKKEDWDLASRIKFSGDFRTRLDALSAESPSHYTALGVGKGVAEVLDAGQNGFPLILGDFGATTATPLAALTAGLPATPAAFVTAATTDTNVDGLTATTQQATDIAAIFYNAEVAALLGSLPAGTTVGDIASNFSSTENLVGFMKNLSPQARKDVFGNLFNQYQPVPVQDYNNDTIWTNRLRLNMKVKATEDVKFIGRLAMYKAWGMQNNPVDYTANAGKGGGPFMLNSLLFDGSATRQPNDSVLRVDRAYLNWTNIADLPMWLSIGRRPTTDGPPAHIRQGLDKRMATPVSYMDYPFDGLTLGYAYRGLLGNEDYPGLIRFCYGRGFESGPTEDGNGLKDVDFAGISWDIINMNDQFLNVQSFAAFDMFNVPDNIDFVNPIEYYVWQIDSSQFDPTDSSKNLILDRANLGNIYHSATVYMNKYNNLNYFFAGGWSRTDPKGVDELGNSLLGSFWDTPEEKDGYSFYAGLRYDLEDLPLKLGLEYNHGTENWIAFTPGNDDLYASKLATRGNVYEAYTIWDIPAGEAISKYGRAFMRLGYQHYDYDYTGSGFWLGEPLSIDALADDPLKAQFYAPIDSMDQIYLTFEASF